MFRSAPLSRRLFMAGGSALTLSACGNLIGPPEGGTIYTMRPAFTPSPAQSGAGKVNWSLALMRPDTPGGLDTTRIALLQPDGTMDYYAKAAWPDRLPSLVQRALLDGFEASGRADDVAIEEDALHSDYNLFTGLRDFEAKYEQRDGIPQAVVSLNVKLATARGRKIIASFAISRTQAASVNSAGAAAEALTLALGSCVTAIVNWTLETAPASPAPDTSGPGKPAEQLLHDAVRGSNRLRKVAPPQP